MYKIRGDISRAILTYQEALRENPSIVEIRINLANTYIAQGDMASAERECEIIERLAPNHPLLKNLRARLSR
jgi:tetratricopeptide (TPR) repeat protein